jgi:hypothetical protein
MAKSIHLPFEDWLLAETPLNAEEERALQAHLHTCEDCRRLATAWREVDRQLRTAPILAPVRGFTGRWQTRWEAERRIIHRRQTLAIMLFCLGGTGLLLASLGLLAVPLLDAPRTFVWAWIYQMMSLISLAGGAGDLASSLLKTMAQVIPLPGWVLFIGLFSELAVLWVVTMRILTNPRRVSV